MDKLRQRWQFLFIVFVLSVLSGFFTAYAQEPCRVVIFHSHKCSSCLRINSQVIPAIEQKYKGRIKAEYYDITELENYKLLLAYAEKYKIEKKSLPLIIVGDKFLSGEKQVRDYLDVYIQLCLSSKGKIPIEVPPEVDLIKHFRTFDALVIIIAGLIDGVNPCAFTVIVFFVTFLALQGYEKKKIILTGMFFILAVFLTYLLLGLGLFNFLYRLKALSYLMRILYRLVAGLCFVLGALAIYDVIVFKKTGQAESMLLRLPERIKFLIQRIIGRHYRKTKEESRTSGHILGLAASALVAGFIISILEAVCTGQIYLPTITFVLRVAELRLKAAWYLVLYNLMFILPLVAVFLLALWGVVSGEFSYFMRKHMIAIKIFTAVLFISLGVMLIAGL